MNTKMEITALHRDRRSSHDEEAPVRMHRAAPSIEASGTDKAHRQIYGAQVPRLFAFFTGVALFGWTVSTFLTGIHFWALPLPAGSEPQGSMLVITSQWAYIAGVPLALMGALYYLTVTLAAGLWFQTRNPFILKALTPITAIGVVMSGFFVYLQLGPIGAICPFCMMSAAATVVLFATELRMLQVSRLPSVRELLAKTRQEIASVSPAWAILLASTALLALLSFYGVTLAPIPR